MRTISWALASSATEARALSACCVRAKGLCRRRKRGAWLGLCPRDRFDLGFFLPPLVSRLPFRPASTTTSQRLVISGTTTPRQPLLRAQLQLPQAPAGLGSHQRSLYGRRLISGAHRSHTAVLGPGRDGAGHRLGLVKAARHPPGVLLVEFLDVPWDLPRERREGSRRRRLS